MPEMEAVAGFEIGWRVIGLRMCVKQASVEQTVGGVDHPDRDEHGSELGPAQGNAGAARDKEGPERCDGGGVEREQMP
jgi:hypothetical protein